MVEIGKWNNLRILKELEFGCYLNGEELGEILLPKRYVPEYSITGDVIEVFIYLDSEDRVIATTHKPYTAVGEFAFLEVVSVNEIGAFLDWGLPKDILVPYREQQQQMFEGKYYLVYVYLDIESRRIVASAKVDKFLDNLPINFKEGDQVDILIYKKTELGYKAIINATHSGILYKNEIFRGITIGQQMKGFIKKIRKDEKIDLCLHKPGYEAVGDMSPQIISALKEYGGFIALTDKSPAEKIYNAFGVSKKVYKKAIGCLYKKKMILIEEGGIRLII